ncbi:unnamed protein product [Polarella glacialis]|uniref:Uncharacterized protein n=1 Tax=Polarella glacialis TaxID=89957 RepID=A0A813E7Z7_POLGL|nr:unnamed protein product [Polarella glacialis]
MVVFEVCRRLGLRVSQEAALGEWSPSALVPGVADYLLLRPCKVQTAGSKAIREDGSVPTDGVQENNKSNNNHNNNKWSPLAVVEAKRCLPSIPAAAWAELFTAGAAQTAAFLDGQQLQQQQQQQQQDGQSCAEDPSCGSRFLLGIITDGRRWLLLEVQKHQQQKQQQQEGYTSRVAIQLWPGGCAVLEMSEPSKLALFLACLEERLKDSSASTKAKTNQPKKKVDLPNSCRLVGAR